MLPVSGLSNLLELQGIHSLWLPLLGQGVHRKDQAEHQGWHWAQGLVSKFPKAPQDLPPPPWPASCLLGFVTERASGSIRGA